MDPYLEKHWGDIHQAFITYVRDALQIQMPDHLRARMQERVYIEQSERIRHEYYPDVRLIERPGRVRAGAGVAVAEPETASTAVADHFVIDLRIEPRTESYVEVIDLRSGHRVITTIEVISPTNKRSGEGRRLYVDKQNDMIRAGVNTVEIDLIREGEPLLPVSPARLPPDYIRASLIWISQATDTEHLTVYRIPLPVPLPVIPIPLGPGDADATIDLQTILDQCYRNGAYDDIDYRRPASPPLAEPDASWADALLRERGLR
jgi:hypothetical protein